MVKKNGEIVNNHEDKQKKTEKILKIITALILLFFLVYNWDIFYELIRRLFN